MENKSKSDFILVVTSVNQMDDARNIAKLILSRKLSPCINIIPGIESLYPWDKEIIQEKELLLLIKTMYRNYKLLEESILEVHPYKLPEITFMPITGAYMPFLKWLESNII